jgi:hypothetical protein
MSSFFGLRAEDKPAIHDQIFSLCFHGKGGFTHSEVYEMPTYLRRFYIAKASKFYDEEKKEMDKATKKAKGGGISRPGVTRGR